MPTGLKQNDPVIHPKHGLGCLGVTEEHAYGGETARFVTVAFDRAMLTVRIPEDKIADSGLRPPCSRENMRAALAVLSEEPAKIQGHWSKRRVILEEMLNSGEPVRLAGLIRDLHGGTSTSGTRLFHEAMLRLAEELAVVEGMTLEKAQDQISALLSGEKK